MCTVHNKDPITDDFVNRDGVARNAAARRERNRIDIGRLGMPVKQRTYHIASSNPEKTVNYNYNVFNPGRPETGSGSPLLPPPHPNGQRESQPERGFPRSDCLAVDTE